MKLHFLRALPVFFLLSIAAPLSAGEIILYGGAQKPGDLRWSDASLSEIAGDLKADFGGTFGIRYSAGRVIGFEQSLGYSPRFARPGIKAFQTDSNLLIQFPGKFVPYGTAGIGLVRLWGQDFPTSFNREDIVAFAFSTGNSFAYNYGGGLKIRRLLGPLGIGIDIRGYTLPDVKAKIEDSAITEKGLSFVQTTVGFVITS